MTIESVLVEVAESISVRLVTRRLLAVQLPRKVHSELNPIRLAGPVDDSIWDSVAFADDRSRGTGTLSRCDRGSFKLKLVFKMRRTELIETATVTRR